HSFPPRRSSDLIGILAGLALLIVPGLVLLTWWLVLSPVIMLEACSVAHGLPRSRSLVRGPAWPVFGVVVLTLLVLLGFSLALGLALTPLDGPTRGFLQAAVGHTLAAPLPAPPWDAPPFPPPATL